MDSSSADFIWTLATSIATAIVTALVTVRLSVRQFQSQKWWERKVDAYTRIIEALQAMYRFDTEAFDADVEGRELPEEYAKRLRNEWSAGRDELEKAVGYGTLVISAEAYRALMELQDGIDAARRERTWAEHLDTEGAALAACLGDLRRFAAKDLGVSAPRKWAVLSANGRTVGVT